MRPAGIPDQLLELANVVTAPAKVRAWSVLDRMRRKIGWALLTTKPFRLFLWLGVQVTPVHFYSPIPDVRELRDRPEIWEQPSQLPGVDMRPDAQRALMNEVFSQWQAECDFPQRAGADPSQYHTDNVYFGYASAVAMYSLIRECRPHTIVEAGAGYSTLVIAAATQRNAAEGDVATVITIDPELPDFILTGVPGVSRLIAQRLQDVEPSLFETLRRNDILSIDTSHTVKTGGEVPYLYLEVLPRLQPGVLVHVHDIHMPDEYPADFVLRRYFWNEQYLVHAFLIGNSLFEVVWGQRYAELNFPEEYARTFGGRTSDPENNRSYSLWMRRADSCPP